MKDSGSELTFHSQESLQLIRAQAKSEIIWIVVSLCLISISQPVFDRWWCRWNGSLFSWHDMQVQHQLKSAQNRNQTSGIRLHFSLVLKVRTLSTSQSHILFSITVWKRVKIAIFCNSTGETEYQIPPFQDLCKQTIYVWLVCTLLPLTASLCLMVMRALC